MFLVRPRKRDEEIRKLKREEMSCRRGFVNLCVCVRVWMVLKMHTKESQRAD